MLTIFLLILVFSFFGKPIGKLVDKVKNVNWSEVTSKAWESIKSFSLKAGRTTCTPLLYFYYVMKDENTSVSDKALVYGAILYIISPFDLLPRRILGWIGGLDDVAITAFVMKKIQDKITPQIESAVKGTLEDWFGAPQVSQC